HEDIKSTEMQASYEMVEKVAEEIMLPSTTQEAKPTRPQAAVKGITPMQPAPVREEKPREQASFLDKFFGWFRPTNHEHTQEEHIAGNHKERSQRHERGRGRRDRSRSGRSKEMLAHEQRKHHDLNEPLHESSHEITGALLQEQITPGHNGEHDQKNRDSQSAR